jgi:ABC-type iron transport system FetAB permease component
MVSYTFDINNLWTLLLIIIVCIFIIYALIKSCIYFDKKTRKSITKLFNIERNSKYTQTDNVLIAEYDEYSNIYLNGYAIGYL